MAFSLSNNDYSGKFDGNTIISAAIFKAKTLAGGYVNFIPGVKDSTNIPVISSTSPFQSETCGWSPAHTTTLDNKKIEVQPLETKEELCTKDLLPHYYSALMKAGSSQDDIPFGSWLVEYKSKLQATEFDRLIWAGTGNTGGQFTGLYYTLSADTNTINITGSTLTEANILTEIRRVYTAIPDVLKENPDYKIFIPNSAYGLFQLAMSNSGATSTYTIQEEKKLLFLGKEIVSVQLPANKIIAALPTDLHVASDLGSDIEEIKVKDMREFGESNFRYFSKFKGGTGVSNSNQIVLYNK